MPSKRSSARAMFSRRLHSHLRKLEADHDVLISIQQAMQRQFNVLVMEELQLASAYRGLEEQRKKASYSTKKGGRNDPKSAALKRGGGHSKSSTNSDCKEAEQRDGQEDSDESAGQWVLDEPMDLNLENKM